MTSHEDAVELNLPDPTNVPRVKRFRTRLFVIFLLCFAGLFIAGMIGEHVPNDTVQFWAGVLEDVCPVILSILGFILITSAHRNDTSSLNASDLIDMTTMIQDNPELKPFAQAIKDQGRDPVQNDYKTVHRLVKKLENRKKQQQAQKNWDSLNLT